MKATKQRENQRDQERDDNAQMLSSRAPNDIEFSGERKRVRCNELLGRAEVSANGNADRQRPGRWMTYSGCEVSSHREQTAPSRTPKR